ncbi:MAG: alpha-L-fucosidase [Lentisphaerae bacterium]|nr:alpha-L-fucosidase [Lentisphaerota bacterium]
MQKENSKIDWFMKLRYGMFIHYGIYSMLGRGEWAINRERIPVAEYKKLATSFTAENFDADAICNLAVEAGMKYITFTTMHLDGFRLYDTDLSDFNSMKSPARRDLVAEIVAAARKRGLGVSLYHSLTNWTAEPDGADALEDPVCYEKFIANTHARVKELVTRFNPIDVMWYDGWWPFNAEGWKAQAMNAMVKSIQPQILVNGRNGLPGDFATPEGHMAAPSPWRPWEACMTLNNHWGYHGGDNEWKTPNQVIDLLRIAAQGQGNLLLNIGPKGDGSIPDEAKKILKDVGAWLRNHGEAIFDTDRFTLGYEKRGKHVGDWSNNGPFTARGNFLYQTVRYWPGKELTVAGLQCKVKKVVLLGDKKNTLDFKQQGEKVTVSGMPEKTPGLMPVIRFECDAKPIMYLTGGMRVPKVPHPPYDPCPSDMI